MKLLPLNLTRANKHGIALLCALLFFISPSLCARSKSLEPAAPPATRASPTPVGSESFIRVNSTSQDYNLRQPWQQTPPQTGTAIGAIIQGNRVLVTATLIADHRYVELEDIDTGQTGAAEVEVVDYEAKLAILKPQDESFLTGKKPLELIDDATSGDILSVLQVQPNGNVITSDGPVTSVEQIAYAYGNFFLVYRLNNSLQYRFNNRSLPVLKGNKLAGLLLRYDLAAQTSDVIAAPVIAHFIKDAADGEYQGFPLAGIDIAHLTDPQLRKYIGIPDGKQGVFVNNVVRGRPAELNGIAKGDVILEIAGFSIDNRGNYTHPLHGKLALAHLIRTEHFVGETIPFKIFRGGKELELQVKLAYRKPEEYLVPPYLIDRAPKYFVLGGLIIQELSLPYLQAVWRDWYMDAPPHLVYYQQNQDFDQEDIAHGRDKIVFVSDVLPTSYNNGYEGISNAVITQINNKKIRHLNDISAALESPINGFHKIDFELEPKTIYFDAKEMPDINEQLRQLYGLPTLENLD